MLITLRGLGWRIRMLGQMDGIGKLKAHKNNQYKEKNGSFKCIGHEDYYPIMNEGWKLF